MRLTILTAALAATLLGGCATVDVARSVREAETTVAAASTDLLDNQPVRHAFREQGAIVTDVPYVDPTPISRTDADPAIFSKVVTLNEPIGLPIQRMMSRIAELTGMRVTYDADIVEGGGQRDSAAAAAQAEAPVQLVVDSTFAALPQLNNLPTTTLSSAGVQQGGAPSPDASTNIAIVYTGKARGLLDQAAAGMGASWRYDAPDNRIHFYRYLTETLRIATVPGSVSSQASVGGQQGGSNQNSIPSSAQAESKALNDVNVWESLESGVKQLLSPSGTYSISQATTSITIRDRPDRVEAVRKYVRETNATITQQVAVEVRVYRFEKRKSDRRGISWDILANQFAQQGTHRWRLITPRTSDTDLGAGVITVPVRGEDGDYNQLGGSAMAIDSLSRVGNTTEITKQSVITINNQPAPLKVVRRVTYLASTTPLVGTGASNGSAVSAGASLTPGQVETGLSMQILPSVQPDGRQIQLQVLLSLSTLDNMNTLTSGGQSIQAPDVSSREFLQRVWMNSGETLVLAGFERYDTGNTKEGVLDAGLWGLGGTRSRAANNESIVITITPLVSQDYAGI